jgi:hypothetical protein
LECYGTLAPLTEMAASLRVAEPPP